MSDYERCEPKWMPPLDQMDVMVREATDQIRDMADASRIGLGVPPRNYPPAILGRRDIHLDGELYD